jgi:ammonium transporter, Amt family
VAITPAAGFVTPAAAILIGGIAAIACYIAVRLRERMRVDDALDVFPVHGIGGTVGALLTGVFATTAINAAGANGLAYGNPKQFLIQLLAVGASWAYTAVATLVILKIVMLVVPLRVSERDEKLGLDVSQPAEAAYVT